MKILDLSGYTRGEVSQSDVSKQVQVPKSVQARVAAAMVYEDRKESESRPKMTDVYVQMLKKGFEKMKDWERENKAFFPFPDLTPVKHESAPILWIAEGLNEHLKEIRKRYPAVKSVVPIINHLIEIGCDATPTKTVK